MSNFPDENPNIYLGLQRAGESGAIRVTATGPGIELDATHADPAVLAGQLNQMLKDLVVYCRTAEVVDQVAEIFTAAGTPQGFSLEEVAYQWHPDMITDFQRIASQALNQGLGEARAIQQAHEQMIPF